MKAKIITVAVFLTCLSSPAYTTGLLEAKMAAAAGVVKGAALLGAGALAAKGAVLKGIGSILAAKGAALNDIMAAKPVEVAVPTIMIGQPATGSQPCILSLPNIVMQQQPVVESKPCVVSVPSAASERPTAATSKPNVNKPDAPLLAVDLQTPIVSAGVELLPKPVVSLLSDRVDGLLTTIDNTLDNTLNKIPVVGTLQSPVVYKILRTPQYYPVSIY